MPNLPKPYNWFLIQYYLFFASINSEHANEWNIPVRRVVYVDWGM